MLALGCVAGSATAQQPAAQTPPSPAAASSTANPASTTTPPVHHAKRPKKKEVAPVQAPPPPPPPTPEQSPAGTPVVSYEQGQLTIHSENSTLSSILNAVKSSLGASVEAPGSTASDRIATQIGPGDPRDVLSTLLNNSKYDFILMGAPGSPTSVEKIILTARAAGVPAAAAAAPVNKPAASFQTQGQIPEDQDVPDSEIPDDANQPEQPPPPTDPEQANPQAQPQATPNGQAEGDQQNPNQAKSPEQLLQELQRMQQQQQQQQQQQPPNESPE